MSVTKGLQRLLRIRELQEEQERAALESSVKRLREIEAARDAASERQRRGHKLVGESARSGILEDRLAGVAQATAAQSYGEFLTPRIANAEENAARMRQSFLERHVERRQAETLIEEAAGEDALDSSRRSQQALDDWYGSRRFGEKRGDR